MQLLESFLPFYHTNNARLVRSVENIFNSHSWKEPLFEIKLNNNNYKVLTTKQSEKLYARLTNGLKERKSLMKTQWGKITAYIDRCD